MRVGLMLVRSLGTQRAVQRTESMGQTHVFFGEIKRLRERVRKALQGAGLPFSEGVGVAGYQAEFLFQTPDGAQHIVETKRWEHDLSRAVEYASHLKQLPVRSAYLVVPELRDEHTAQGVVSLEGFRKILDELARQSPSSKASPGMRLPAQPRTVIFAAMPFASHYDDVFFVAIRAAAKSAGGVAKRVDQDEYSGDVVERIGQHILQARAVVVDLSESHPNVLYEMGFAQGSGKPVVPICSTPVDKLPFDVRNLNVLAYEKGQTSALRPRLARRLRAILIG